MINKYKVDYNGKIYKIINYKNYLQLLSLIILNIIIKFIIKNIKYKDITLFGTNFYSDIIYNLYLKFNIPFNYITTLTHTRYYETDDNYQIPFDGSSSLVLLNQENNKEIKELNNNEIDIICKYTNSNKDDFIDIQNIILKEINNLDELLKPINNDLEQIISIKYYGELFYFITNKSSWFSKILIQTNSMLKNNDIIITNTIKDNIVNRQICYNVINNKIHHINKNYNKESIIYSLLNPNPFNKFILHPFNIPSCSNPILAICILSLINI